MILRPERLPADPATGPIRCRDCLRQLRVYGYPRLGPRGPRSAWRCRKCAVRNAVAHGMPRALAHARVP